MDKPQLLPRMIAYLATTPDEWISEDELRSQALLHGYTHNHINATLERLRMTEHIGSLWNNDKKVVTFKWYPPSEDSEFRQNAIDNF